MARFSEELPAAYIEGEMAFHQNAVINPYPKGTQQHDDWDDGYMDASDEATEEDDDWSFDDEEEINLFGY